VPAISWFAVGLEEPAGGARPRAHPVREALSRRDERPSRTGCAPTSCGRL